MQSGEDEEHRRCSRGDKKSLRGRGSESALYEVICPAVYVIRVFGLAPYEFGKDKANGSVKLKSSAFYCLFSLFWMGIYSYVVVTSVLLFGGVNTDKPVLGITETTKLIINYVISMIDLLLNIWRRGDFVEVWNAIEEFDESFGLGVVVVDESTDEELCGGSRRYSPMLRITRFWIWTALALSVIGWTIINQLGMHAFNEPYLKNVGYMLTYVGTCVAVFKLCGLIFLLGQRFAHLNDMLRKQLLLSPPTFRLLLYPRRNDPKYSIATGIVKKIETSYNKLLSTSEKLNDTYSCSLFLFLFNLFCHLVSNMYYFAIWTIVDRIYMNNPKVVFCVFSWLVIYLIQLLLLHVACHYTSLEANRMAYILLDWRRRVIRQSKHDEFISTLHYMNRRLNFTAAGCFNVDLPLLTSTFGHLATYLVILLQIPNSDN